MWSRRVLLRCLAACVAAGCAPDPEVTTAALRLRALPSCPLAGLQRLRLTLDGDFPSVEHELRAGERFTLASAPLATRWFAVAGESDGQNAGGAIARERAEQGAGVVLLPLDASCALGDPLAAGYDAAAVAALPDGSLLIAGGRLESGASSASAALLPAGELLAHAVEGGMLLRRAGASATVLADGVLVAGGGAGDDGPAHDTYEIYEHASQRFAPPQKLGGERRDHAALRLPDGRVLLAGGLRTLGGEPLASAELFDPAQGRVLAVGGELQQPRAHASALLLDDGRALIALGRQGDRSAATTVERFDPERERFAEVAELPANAQQAVAALEGGRVAYAGCGADGAAGAGDDDEPICTLGLLVPDGERFAWHASAIDSLARLRELRLLALRDGQLLLTARDAQGGSPRAFLLDLARDRASELPASRAPNALHMLADGTIAELDPFGASLRRHDRASALHDAPDPVIGDGNASVVLDLAARWDRRSGLLARSAARLDLPALRFAALRIELTLSGAARLLLEPDGAPALAVELEDGALRVAGSDCTLAHKANAPLTIERSGSTLTLGTGGETRRCNVTALADGRVGIALEAKAGTRVQRLRVLRR